MFNGLEIQYSVVMKGEEKTASEQARNTEVEE